MTTAKGTPVRARLEHVTKTYAGPGGRRIRALEDVSVEIPEGVRLTALIGPDGAGKSTLLKLLCGLEAPDLGRAEALGQTPDPDNPDLVQRVAFMPQQLGLYRELSCMENLMLSAELRGLEGEEASAKALELLELTGLGPFSARHAGNLSGGMKQKLALASALLASPDLLLLDEATVGVDPISRRELWGVLRNRLAAGTMSCIFSTAYLEEAETAESVIFLEEGRLIASGTPQQLIESARGRTYALRLAGVEAARAEALKRRLMRAVRSADPASVWLDAVPREGRLDLLVAGDVDPAAADLRAALPADLARGIELEARPARLV
ncbi:ATP-binding cassette domain-containing protein [Sutterella sp.]|uniref:ATP-binding cassette domain-containing protein n=1 Tax=Sutterella sp. TaxID=1981025 RepID=UPI0026E037AC|nr:ABC transporter ATP-binding protein [Sutterella sp.]MDO5532653.1 ABC transporter ATP-binding protein [Sutterella sp.]